MLKKAPPVGFVLSVAEHILGPVPMSDTHRL